MSKLQNTPIPVNDPPQIITKDGTKTIYAADYTLTQADMGYELPPESQGGAIAATENVSVYADVLTINGKLILPGKDLKLVARKIICENGAFLDVAGPKPVENYPPGRLPTDKNPPKNGSNGSPAGSITVCADQIVDSSGGETSFKVVSDMIQEVCTEVFHQISGEIPDPISVPHFQYKYKVDVPIEGEATGITYVNEMKIHNFSELKLGVVQVNPHYNTITIALQVDEVYMKGTFGFDQLTPIKDKESGIPYTSNKINAQLIFEATFDPKTFKISDPHTRLDMSIPLVWIPAKSSYARNNQIEAGILDLALNAEIAKFLESAKAKIGTSSQHLIQEIVKKYNQKIATKITKSALYLSALGGRGGRGQDGIPGTTNKSWGQGGQGGNAGRSGNGGAGGHITINCVSADGPTIVADCEGGPGGMKANPGHIGLGIPPGKPAAFQGNYGTQGTAGTLTVGHPGTFTRTKLGPLLNIEQLLFTQRTANFAYLNARTKTDFQACTQLYLFLSEVTADAALGGLKPHDVALRKGMHSTANAEILRLYRGLDYYGNVYNWAPNETYKQIKEDATHMIDWAGEIESQYDIYKKQEATAQQKIAAAKAAIEHVKNQIGSSTVKGSLEYELKVTLPKRIAETNKDIEELTAQVAAQKQVVMQDQAALKKAIQETAPHCTLSNMFDILTTLFQFGAAIGTEDPEAAAEAIEGVAKDAAGKAVTAAGQTEHVIETFKMSKAEFADMNNIYQQIKAALAGNADGAKIGVLKANFELEYAAFDSELSKKCHPFGRSGQYLDLFVPAPKCKSRAVQWPVCTNCEN